MKFFLPFALCVTLFPSIAHTQSLKKSGEGTKLEVKPQSETIDGNLNYQDCDGFIAIDDGQFGKHRIRGERSHLGADGKEDPIWVAKKQKWKKLKQAHIIDGFLDQQWIARQKEAWQRKQAEYHRLNYEWAIKIKEKIFKYEDLKAQLRLFEACKKKQFHEIEAQHFRIIAEWKKCQKQKKYIYQLEKSKNVKTGKLDGFREAKMNEQLYRIEADQFKIRVQWEKYNKILKHNYSIQRQNKVQLVINAKGEYRDALIGHQRLIMEWTEKSEEQRFKWQTIIGPRENVDREQEALREHLWLINAAEYYRVEAQWQAKHLEKKRKYEQQLRNHYNDINWTKREKEQWDQYVALHQRQVNLWQFELQERRRRKKAIIDEPLNLKKNEIQLPNQILTQDFQLGDKTP